MNAKVDLPGMKLEVPGLDEIVNAEIGIVTEDVERLERNLDEATMKSARLAAQIEKLKKLLAATIHEKGVADTQLQTVRRMLVARRRTLFDLRQEVE